LKGLAVWQTLWWQLENRAQTGFDGGSDHAVGCSKSRS